MFIHLLVSSPLFLLFTVCGIGCFIGKLPIFGVRLGIAGVLFTGLAVSSLDSRLILPEMIYTIGLVLFVYTTGIGCGPIFFEALRRTGMRDNALVLLGLTAAAGITVVLQPFLGLSSTFSSGMFAGSLTNTPALASILEQLHLRGLTGEALQSVLAEPVVAYSLTYPLGVVGMITVLVLGKRLDSRSGSSEQSVKVAESEIMDRTIQILNGVVPAETFGALREREGWHLLPGRLNHAGHESLASQDSVLCTGDLISLIGSKDEVERACQKLGAYATQDLWLDHSAHDFRRVFVSNPKLAGKRVRDLGVAQLHGAVVTRVRRGDTDLLAEPGLRLRLGDRVRVVAPREALSAVTRFFGDSYKDISEVEITTFSLGIALGLLVGMISLPLPGGHAFSLGFAGGPLLVGLLLGTLSRTGPLCWTLPYSANLSIRQLGLVLFLAGVGTKSGFAFASTLQRGTGWPILVGGMLITAFTGVFVLLLGLKVFKVPYATLAGVLAGIQTQPAVLAFAKEQTRDDRTDIGYSAVYPFATLAKLIVAQLLLG